MQIKLLVLILAIMLFQNGWSQNVGIGTSEPSAKLDVVGDAEINGNTTLVRSGAFNTSLFFRSDDQLSEAVTDWNTGRIVSGWDANENLYAQAYLRFENPTGEGTFTTALTMKNGNTGLGINPSIYRLSVDGNSYFLSGIGIRTPPSSSYSLSVLGRSFLNGNLGIGGPPDIAHQLYTKGISYFEGNVGIGTGAGIEKLVVQGNTRFQGRFSINKKNPNYAFENENRSYLKGNVGVGGFPTITDKLLVVGNSRIQGKFSINRPNPVYAFENSGQTYLLGNVGLGRPPSGDATIDLSVNGRAEILTTLSVGTAADANYRLLVDGRSHFLHGSMSSTSWGITIKNTTRASNQGGIRISNDGFLDISNVAGTSNTAARLTSTGFWTVTSDRRLKKDISYEEDFLDKTLAMKPARYRYKSTDSPRRELGFIAQDVQALFPEFVAVGDYLSVNYAGLSVVAIGAIKELNTKVEDQKDTIDKLEARVARLEEFVLNNRNISATKD